MSHYGSLPRAKNPVPSRQQGCDSRNIELIIYEQLRYYLISCNVENYAQVHV